jgi:hypothetical protein
LFAGRQQHNWQHLMSSGLKLLGVVAVVVVALIIHDIERE